MTTTLVEETRKETKTTTGNSVSDAVSQRTTMCQVPADGIRSPGLVTYNVVTQLRQACSICYSCSIALCHITASAQRMPHKSTSMNKIHTCVGTVMASFKGCSIWPQLVGAADSAGRLPRKASKCGRTDDRVCSSAVRLTRAPRRCSRMSLMRDRSAFTPSQSASILLACTKNQVHKSA